MGLARAHRALALLAAACCLGACATLPTDYVREPSTAELDTGGTTLGRTVAARLAGPPPGQSLFYPLQEGTDAFAARVALARAAERTLDVQYYIFHADDTGLALLDELLAAADRGVRVRLLLDDIHSAGLDEALAAIDAHPRVEVRLFNPFANRGVRWLDLLGDFGRVNRRMHNKSMTADNQVTLVGGRNVGDEYFGAATDKGFSDLDVLAAGPVVREVSAVFDEYWNSDVAYPIAALAADANAQANLQAQRGKVSGRALALRATPYAVELAQTGLARTLAEGRLPVYRGRGTVIADSPSKVTRPPEDASTHAIPKLAAILSQAQRELILVSPYFVPGEKGTRWLREIVARGVRVTVLTNSFAATDVRAVHAAYSRYREALLQAGVTLYELKPDATRGGSAAKKLTGSSHASLHAKAYMVDATTLFVGSLNLDPRSARLNTEMGVVLESPELCASLREPFERALGDIAYRVERQPGTGGERLVWITREDGREVRYEDEPGLGAGQRLLQSLLRILPLEEQL